MITLNIDHKQIQVEEGTTILEAAQKAEIYIPTFCYHPDLKFFQNVVALLLNLFFILPL